MDPGRPGQVTSVKSYKPRPHLLWSSRFGRQVGEFADLGLSPLENTCTGSHLVNVLSVSTLTPSNSGAASKPTATTALRK
jgi:hypothetical protein